MTHKVLITGAAGYLGSQLLPRLAANPNLTVLAADVRQVAEQDRVAGVQYRQLDIREEKAVHSAIAEYAPCTIVHLAAIVSPGRKPDRKMEYDVDVNGTRYLLDACLETGVRRVIITSSGAAYGYYSDNAEWLTETEPIRGNEEFSYSCHKRLVEEMLVRYRVEHPRLQQTIFRIGTILGSSTRNQITDLFDRPWVLAVKGYDSPFVFIWDQDLVALLERAVTGEKTGIYNVAGNGAMTMRDLAKRMNKPLIEIPAWVLRSALAVLHPLGLVQYGPEQVRFLQYRPVLDNRALREDFGFIPSKTSREVFDFFLSGRRASRQREPVGAASDKPDDVPGKIQ